MTQRMHVHASLGQHDAIARASSVPSGIQHAGTDHCERGTHEGDGGVLGLENETGAGGASTGHAGKRDHAVGAAVVARSHDSGPFAMTSYGGRSRDADVPSFGAFASPVAACDDAHPQSAARSSADTRVIAMASLLFRCP